MLVAKIKHPKKQSKRHFYTRRRFLIPLGIVVGIIIAILIAFRVSPWPGAMIIRAVFEKGDAKVLAALQKYTPSTPITTLVNQQYRAGDKDAQLDVYFPQSITNTDQRLPVIVWTHGGAWVSGGKDGHVPYYKLLAAQGFAVVAPNYSLAPEKTYPTAIHQLNDMYSYIQSNAQRFHVDTDQFILAGDSAGAQLSSQLATLITSSSYAAEIGISPTLKSNQLRAMVLYCGIYKMNGLTHPDPTLPKIVGWGDDVSVWAYSGTRDFSDPVIKQMSAYYHVTSNFPTTFLSGGNGDPLTKEQSMPFDRKLESLGVEVTKLFYEDNHLPSLPHEYQFNLDNADGQHALSATITFMKAHTQ
jgi:acetyl esterase